jgi:hypothetical protein
MIAAVTIGIGGTLYGPPPPVQTAKPAPGQSRGDA